MGKELVIINVGNVFLKNVQLTLGQLEGALELWENTHLDEGASEDDVRDLELVIRDLQESIHYWEIVLQDNNYPTK